MSLSTPASPRISRPAHAINYWPDAKCAKAFWGQHDLPTYQELLRDTVDWTASQTGERWLDLGCGSGAISRELWLRTQGGVGEVLGLDCAGANETAYAHLASELSPAPGHRVRFVCHDFSSGLELFADARFEGVVSGLSITYAESFDPVSGEWTTAAYDHLLGEIHRVLVPGGRFVVSVNVPEPSWGAVAWRSFPALLQTERPLQALKRSWRMLKYGRWLKQEARIGRFHYLPADDVSRRLRETGFIDIEHRLSYAKQAFVFRAVKPR